MGNPPRLVEPPPFETMFRRMIDAMGHHGKESIPVAEVFVMFEAMFHYEHNYNLQLQKLLYERLDTSPFPMFIMKREVKAEDGGN